MCDGSSLRAMVRQKVAPRVMRRQSDRLPHGRLHEMGRQRDHRFGCRSCCRLSAALPRSGWWKLATALGNLLKGCRVDLMSWHHLTPEQMVPRHHQVTRTRHAQSPDPLGHGRRPAVRGACIGGSSSRPCARPTSPQRGVLGTDLRLPCVNSVLVGHRMTGMGTRFACSGLTAGPSSLTDSSRSLGYR
jgi:hypothetical protein